MAETVAQAIRGAAVRLAETSETPRLDAEVLMAHALGVSRSEMLVQHMDAAAPDTFMTLVERRTASEPVAYITGKQEFYGHDFHVTPDVLIPRGDSEVLVERAIAGKPDARRVLDCGTGSGALLLTCLLELPGATGVGIDSSQAALEIANRNAADLGLGQRVRLVCADWAKHGWSDGLGGPFDLILANPPYVETDAALAPDVRDYEPHGALFAGPDGLDDYRILIPQIPELLSPEGRAFVEIGAMQGEAVSALANASGLAARLHCDLAGRERVVEMTPRW